MSKLYKIYKIIYWPVIFVPSIVIAVLFFLGSLGCLLSGYSSYMHLSEKTHPNIVEAPVDFSRKGSYTFNFNYEDQGSDKVLMLKIYNKDSKKFKSLQTFPLKIRYIYNIYNPDTKEYEENSGSFTTGVCGIEWYIIDRYAFIKEGKNQLKIIVEKPCPALRGYPQTLILNDLICLRGMDAVKSSFFMGIGLFLGVAILAAGNIFLINKQKKKDVPL